MKQTDYQIILWSVLLLTLSLTGCETTQPRTARSQSFHYVNKDMISFGTSSLNFADYDKILIEPVEIYFHPDYKNVTIDADDFTRIRLKFYKILKKALAGQYTVVNQPGEGVLRMRIALMNLVPSSFEARVAPAARLKNSLRLNEMGLDVEFVDSQTEVILATFSDMEIGQKFKQDDVLSEWRHFQQLFSPVVSVLEEVLDFTAATEAEMVKN